MSRPSLTAVPAQRSSLPVLKLRRRAILALLVAASLSGLVSTIAWLTQPDPPAVSYPVRDDAASALASVAVGDWLTGKDTTVPVAAGVNGQFSKTTAGAFPSPTWTYAGATQVRLGDIAPAVHQLVTFHVRTTSEAGTATYEVTATMLATPSGWVLAAAPSIGPLDPAKAGVEVDYTDLYAAGGDASLLRATYGTGVETQVRRWADAFAAGGRGDAALFAVTQDSNPAHRYDGLGGWSVADMRIVSFTQGVNGEASASQFGSTWVAVRVALVLAPPAANGPMVNTEYDVLVQPLANPAQPPVTAWGPAGVGPTSLLTNYRNATTG